MIEDPFSWLYFPTALLLGGLHALEPGHAKTLTAAYLIGIKGTKRDALFLGLSVALTHSIVVIGISVAALWLGRETFTQDVTYWLQIITGITVVILGFWMLIKRIRHLHRVKNKNTTDKHHHDHDHMTDDEHACAHAESIPEYAKKGERPTSLQIVMFGAAGGMIPCPASITVMLLALSIGKFASGILAVAGFSIGLAITLVGIGFAVVTGLNHMKETRHFSWAATNAPIISAVVVIVSGLVALLVAH